MCGIAGILVDQRLDPVSIEQLRCMVAMLRHRGPDGYGLYRDERVGLGHARLSIIDLAGGAQPIHNEDESVWITYNGEIFNYVELREDLERRGHRFYTRTDTEVVVHSFEEYGQQAWEKFNGQFAFALWDLREERLWLVRDRVGILPLYYAKAGDRLLFASEAKALFASGYIQPQFNSEGLAEVFTCWSTPAPSTVFSGVRSVPPGAAICFDSHLGEHISCYWKADLTEDPTLNGIGIDEAAEALADHLTEAVRLRLRADVPVGAYLSGGLDSSLIGHYIRQTDSSPLQTFAIRFADPAFDETNEQRRMASLLHTDHHEIMCGADQIHDTLPELIWHCETPLMRTAPAPLLQLSGLVRDNDMKVVLTGEGADEILAGYHIFKEDKVRRFWARQPESNTRPELLTHLYPYVGDGQRRSKLWQHFFRRGLSKTDDLFYSHRLRWKNTGWCRRFLADDVRNGFDPGQSEANIAGSFARGWNNWQPLARAQAIEMSTFLSSYLLCCQGDRAAMAHGVEVRYPFLDPNVVDFCCRLPGRLKLRGLRDKVVLRSLGSRHLPREIWERPKQPYRAPMTRALFGDGRNDYVEDLLSPKYLERFALFDTPTTTRLVEKARAKHGQMSGEREEMALVGILTLQLLAHYFLEDLSSRVAACRAALDRKPPCILEDRVATPGSRRRSPKKDEIPAR